jgi:hypothetical protein
VVPAQARPDKAELFGDPGLVPTREGERVRTELARATEIAAVLEVLVDVEHAHVDVELDDVRALRGLVISLRLTERGDPVVVEHAVRDVVTAVFSADAADQARVLISTPDASPLPPPRTLGPALAFALLGLGVSLGVTLERLRLYRMREGTRVRRRRSRRSV